MKQTIAVIFGGKSQEHEVSLGSGAQIAEVLTNSKKYCVIPIGITKDGKWFTGKDTVTQFQKGKTAGLSPVVLSADGTRTLYIFEKGKTKKIKIDVVFSWVLGTYGEDGCLQGLFEMCGVPYVGSGVFASACGFNKVTTKKYLDSFGIPQVPYRSFTRQEWKENKDAILKDIEKSLSLPLFVKPASCGSSIGVTKVKDFKKLAAAIDEAFVYDTTALVEQGVPEAVEAEVGVLGNTDLTVSTPGQVVYDGEFYDFHAKYLTNNWAVNIPPKLPAKTVEKVRELAAKVYLSLGATGGARVDFLVNPKTNEVFFNEINTVPGFRASSMYTQLLSSAGISYQKAIETMVALAMARFKDANARKTEFSSGSDWFKK